MKLSTPVRKITLLALLLAALAVTNWEGAPRTEAAGGAWSVTGSLGTARYLHTATLLGNGKVLVAGGQDESSN